MDVKISWNIKIRINQAINIFINKNTTVEKPASLSTNSVHNCLAKMQNCHVKYQSGFCQLCNHLKQLFLKHFVRCLVLKCIEALKLSHLQVLHTHNQFWVTVINQLLKSLTDL